MSTSDITSLRTIWGPTVVTSSQGSLVPVEFTLFARGPRRILRFRSTSAVNVTAALIPTFTHAIAAADLPVGCQSAEGMAANLGKAFTAYVFIGGASNVGLVMDMALGTDNKIRLYARKPGGGGVGQIIAGDVLDAVFIGTPLSIPLQTIEWELIAH